MVILAEITHNYSFEAHDGSERSQAEIGRLPLDTLTAICHTETDNYLRGRLFDSRYGRELFRRALTNEKTLDNHSELAWESVLQVYGGMVANWVRKHPSFFMRDEDVAYYVNRAFERLWRNIACKYGKFEQFKDLKALLRFLKMCVHSAVMDDAPRNAPDSISVVSLSDQTDQLTLSTQLDLSPLTQGEFWQMIAEHLQSEAEKVAMVGYFYYGMKNRELYAQYPTLFRNTKQLSNIRLNVLRRLARLPQFEQRLREFVDDAPYTQRFLSC